MTPAQRKLARHALGLPNSSGRSRRNRYLAPCTPGPYDEWARMADAGLAYMGYRSKSMVWFHLTREGAEAALGPRETLDPEDWA